MVEKKVTVETTAIEEESVRFCDACGDPVGDEYTDYETLTLNPTVKRNRREIRDAVTEVAITMDRKTERNDIRVYPVQSTDGAVHGHEVYGIEPEISEIMETVHESVWAESDGELDVCVTCLETRFTGPEYSALETLNLDGYKDDDPDEKSAFEWFKPLHAVVIVLVTFSFVLAYFGYVGPALIVLVAAVTTELFL